MNRIFQKKRTMPAFVALMAVLLIVSCGMFIDGYNIAQIDENGKEVYYAYAGQNMEFSVNGHLECNTQDNNGVTGSYQFRCRGKAIDKLSHRCFAWHCYIKPACMKCTKCIQRFFCLFQRYVKSQISAVYAKFFKTVIVHGRRAGVSHRGTDQPVKLCVSTDPSFHRNLSSCICL